MKIKLKKNILSFKKDEVIEVDSVVGLAKDSFEIIKTPKAKNNSKPYMIIRAYRAGVWAGHFVSRNGTEVILEDARRIYYWDGAATLSEMALFGVGKPENCKFPAPVSKVEILDACEIIECSEEAEKSIKGVAIWSKK